MRKIISAIYLLCTVCCLSPLSGQVTFTANDATVSCDASSICVEIEVSNFDSITGMQFSYEWDPAILTLDDSTDFLPGFGIFFADPLCPGTIGYSWFASSPFPTPFLNLPDGSVIAELCFIPNTTGTSTLDFGPICNSSMEVSGLVNGMSQVIPATYNPGTIEVQDNEDPVIVCPPDTMISNSGTNVFGIAPVSVTDNCNVQSVSYVMEMGGMNIGSGMNDASGEFFTEGTTTVTYTATDDGGNTANCSFDVVLTAPPIPDTILQFIPEVNIDCENGTVSIDVKVTNFDSMTGMQWGMRWDTMMLEYINTDDFLPPAASYNSMIENGAILFTWFSFSTPTTTLVDSFTIFTLNFNLLNTYNSPGITFEDFSMGIPILVGNVNGNMVQGVDFEFLPETVTVIDNTPPVIDTPCPGNISVPSGAGICEATVSWTPPAFSDNCGIDTIQISHAPGSTFPVGMTTVTYTAIDFGGNMTSCSFTVTVNDQESPIISCPGAVNVGVDAGQCSNSTVNIGMANATDNCGIASVTNDAPATFPIGTTTVIWTASDVNGNTATCSQDITVTDDENPSITCPPDVTACTSGGVNLGSPTTGDNCGVNSLTNDAPGTYPIGVTIVTWTVTDDAGNMATCTQQVTIDDELPTITCPSDVTACHTDSVSLGTPTTNDNCGVQSVTNDAPGTYPTGVTIVTWTVTDLAGNMATCMQSVTIEDNDPPMITCPNVDAFDADPNMCSTVVTNNLTPVVTDCNNFSVTYNITGATTGSGNNDATGTEFFVGQSLVTYYATDDFGNVDSCSILIQVNDSQNPVVNCPSDVVIFVPSGTVDTVVNNIGATASDNCAVDAITFNTNGALTISGNGDISGTAFPPGITNITYVVSDDSGNLDSCTFVVNISEVVNDMIGCPGDQTVFNDPDLCSAVVNGIEPTILINPALVASITYSLSGATTGNGMNDASGETFNVGTTTVEYILTDNSNNMDTCTFDVTVIDNQNPVWTNCPSNITASASLPGCQAIVNWAIPTPTDNCNIAQVITSHNPNDTFNVGTTPVSYIAIDSAGNVGSCSFLVTVVDDTPPSLTCPSDITIGTDPGLCTGTATWPPITVTDNCDLSPTVSCDFNSGDSFPIGTTIVTCTAMDVSGNMATCTFAVTVNDTEPPVVNGCPPNLTINTDQNTCEAIFSWTEPTFVDLCSNPVSVSSTHSPGDTFQVGTTTIFYIAIDASGNSVMCSFDLTVIDNQAPIPVCPPSVTVESMVKECGNVVTWDQPIAADNCDNTVAMIPDIPPGSFFPLGTTTVTYTAVDNSGNTAICTFDVTVEDLTAPEFVCHENIVVGIDGTVVSDNSGAIISITPNNGCDSITIDYLTPPVTDNCTIDSFGIIAGIPAGGVFPVGTTTISYIAIDDSGNSSTCDFDIIVVPLPSIMVTINPSDTVCEGQDIFLSTDVNTPGVTYSWENISSGWTDTIPEPFITDVMQSDSGNYSVTVTYPSGCTSVGSANLVIVEACEVIASSNSPLCNSDDLELMAEVDSSCNVLSFSWVGPGFTSNMQNPVIPNATSANSGTYAVTVEFEGGCSITELVNVEINILSPPTVNTSCGQDICFGTSCLLSGTQYTPAPDSYIWEAIPSAGSGLGNTNSNEISITPTLPGTYIYNYSVEINGCTTEVATALLIVHGEPIAESDNFEIDFENETTIDVTVNDTFTNNLGAIYTVNSGPTNGSIVNNLDGTFTYTPDPGFLGTDQFIYQICYDCESDLCDNAIVTLEVVDNGECIIPTVITPNTDGVNDELFINCLETGNYPNNELVIFNQWGHEVFRASPYQNNWFGTYEGKDLPDGTYFFIFKLDNNSPLEKGSLTIFR